MKKKIVFIMMLVITLTGSYIGTTAAINELVEAPHLTAKPADQVVKEGQTIQIDAVVTGTPKPTVVFYKNNKTIEEDTRISINEDKGRHTLTIKNAKIEDSAIYLVVAQNKAGIAQATCEIHVSTIK
ncbi:immunoglobulin domain-containing protein [uncultured Sanguibacteroides sp.]|uniref:immunoglobulin domain-containing protein n=1 Tax=uncultured Sanguibacteroides sp. TaxID=1635151 RepID=UPI0025EF0F39|nr:immunoglobulin domain-containing protein [uncultured Sanguibacteroides sp.]